MQVSSTTIQTPVCHSLKSFFLVACFIGASYPASASAETYPQRKSGLWALTVEAPGVPTTEMKQCVDEATDRAVQQMTEEASKLCEKNEITKTGSGYDIHTVCNIGGSKITTTGKVIGDFSNSYTVEVNTKHQPPLAGMREGKSTMRGKYLGACAAGQKPGDMILPDGRAMNLNSLPKMTR